MTWPGRADLIPAVVQDVTTGRMLMLAWMNEEAYEATRRTGDVTFWSRSRSTLWTKGETSGNRLVLSEMRWDCDRDTVLVLVHPTGPACHTGTATCFDDGPLGAGFARLDRLWSVVDDRAARRPEGSYTASLLARGPEGPGRKVTEEAVEVLLAATDHARGEADDRRVAEEVADLIFHTLVVLAERGIDPSLVLDVLADREG